MNICLLNSMLQVSLYKNVQKRNQNHFLLYCCIASNVVKSDKELLLLVVSENKEEVLCETVQVLHDKGNAAKRFVLENKTGNLQARKIIPMLQEIIKSQGMSL